MGLALDQSPFLHALADNGPQRIQSYMTKPLKDFEKSSESGPGYLSQLEDVCFRGFGDQPIVGGGN